MENRRFKAQLITPEGKCPFIGNAYTTVAADIVVRHRRQRGDETFFLTGVDEHSTRVYRVAQEQAIDPYEYLDQIAVRWKELPERLNASIDFFIRTSDEGHKAFVRDFLQRIYDNGDIYEGVYAGFYCVRCEAFYAEEIGVEVARLSVVGHLKRDVIHGDRLESLGVGHRRRGRRRA